MLDMAALAAFLEFQDFKYSTSTDVITWGHEQNYKLSNYNSITNRIFLLLYGVRMRTVSESGDIIKSYRFTNLHTYCRWKLG